VSDRSRSIGKFDTENGHAGGDPPGRRAQSLATPMPDRRERVLRTLPRTRLLKCVSFWNGEIYSFDPCLLPPFQARRIARILPPRHPLRVAR
jgi:hypothetical protein